MFEAALAIAEATLRAEDALHFAGLHIHNFHTVNQIAGLYAVCANILYGRRAYLAGNVDEVFESGESLFHRPVNEIAPVLSGAGNGKTVSASLR